MMFRVVTIIPDGEIDEGRYATLDEALETVKLITNTRVETVSGYVGHPAYRPLVERLKDGSGPDHIAVVREIQIRPVMV